jgi:FixJ family two-component response regulator
VSKVSHISIVDDDESIRIAIQSLLESTGFKASVFASAEDFLSSNHLQDADCMIVDVSMPGMSGLDLQSEINAGYRRVPIIFITAHDNQDARAKALKAGAIAFLNKPFSEESLLTGIRSALARHTA